MQVLATLLVTSLPVGGVDPTSVLDPLLPCHISVLPTDRGADLHDARKLLFLGFSKLRQENETRDGAVG